MSESPVGPSEKKLAALLFVAALLVRAVSWMGLEMFGSDGHAFLTMGDLMREGRFDEALSFAYHPLYPMLIALGTFATKNSILAGHLLSVVLGAAAVLPLFKIAREFFGAPAAFVTGLFYALHATVVEVQSDVMTDGTFMFFFLSAAWLTWRLSEEPTLEGAVVLGIVAAAAFLTRPEGLLSIAMALGWPLLSLLKHRPSPMRTLGAVALAAGVILLLIAPYLFWVRGERGHWALSVRPSAISAEVAVVGGDEATRREYAVAKTDYKLYRRYGASVLRLNLYGVLFPFHLLGLAGLRRANRRALAFFFLCTGGYLGAVLYTLRTHNAMSDRYLMPAMALLSALAGLGIARAARMLADRLPDEKRALLAWGGVVVLLTVVPNVLLLRPRNTQQRSFPLAAAWIRAQGGEDRPVSSNVAQVNYLAGRRVLPMPTTREEVRRQIDQERAQFFIYTERDVASRPRDVELLRSCEWLAAPLEIESPPGTEKVFVQRVK